MYDLAIPIVILALLPFKSSTGSETTAAADTSSDSSFTSVLFVDGSFHSPVGVR